MELKLGDVITINNTRIYWSKTIIKPEHWIDDSLNDDITFDSDTESLISNLNGVSLSDPSFE